EPFDLGLAFGESRFSLAERLFEHRRLLSLLARLALRVHQNVVRFFLRLEQRLFLARLGVALRVPADAQRLLLGAADGFGRDAFAVGDPDGKDEDGADNRDGGNDEAGQCRQLAFSGVRPFEIRPASDPARRRATEADEKEGPALPCGEVDEPAKAGGTATKSRASGFLATEACTPRGVATHLGDTLAQTSLPPSRAKQGTQTLEGSRSEEHTSELQSHLNLVCRLLLEKKKKKINQIINTIINIYTKNLYKSDINKIR